MTFSEKEKKANEKLTKEFLDGSFADIEAASRAALKPHSSKHL